MIEKIVTDITGCLPHGMYQSFRRFGLSHNRQWLAGRCDLQRFSKGKTIEKGLNQTVLEIKKGLYDYEYFNICFLNNMLSIILKNASEGKVSRVNVVNQKGENIWDSFFVQPYFDLDIHDWNREDCAYKMAEPFPAFDEIFSDRRIKQWGSVYKKFVRFNERTQKYADDEVQNVLGDGKRTLGVLCRGTDYTESKPKGHPVQPELSEVMDLVEQKMDSLHCEVIYLATEDGKIDRLFRERFGEKVRINKRMYYDEIFDENKLNLIKDVHFDREDDDYLKGVEYLSSIYILSKCNALIAGNCGGSQTAVFMNGGAYEETHIYNLGLY